MPHKVHLSREPRAKYHAKPDTNVIKYAEPFVGDETVLFDMLNSYNIGRVYISNINRESIRAYTTICDNTDKPHKVAAGKAEKEFEIRRAREMKRLESDFDSAAKQLAQKSRDENPNQ
ncbi:MAG: hypothetical protein LBU26_06300 [Synergistaceae bacterium]|nr:hypothetical protein [Synergistaceae bacterium]